MLKIYIARHGQNEDNANGILNGHRDMPLTAIGEKQAHELADGIKDAELTFDAVYTSPLSRAKKTAEVVCETLGLNKPVVLDSLIERDFGTMTGQLASDIERLCAPDIVKTETITYFLSPPGAETFPELLERASRALNQIRTEHPTGSVLLVTHGDFGKMIYASYYGLPWQDMLTMFHFGNCELLLLAEGANPNEPHVVKIEQHNH
jgi:broad specificity phosphatase PhoE